jgi:hypothetical protein
MIVGMELLKRFSPMKVHWSQKRLTIPYGNSHVTLQGILAGVLDCNMVELAQLEVQDFPDSTASLHHHLNFHLEGHAITRYHYLWSICCSFHAI